MNQLTTFEAARLQVSSRLESIPFWKRALDITCVLLAAPIVVPLGFIIAAIIKIVSPGPVFFQQERIGFRGRPFKCFKFRTMVVNAETGVHQGHLADLMKSNVPMTKLDGRDPRVIVSGVWLRALGLDELPQLLNVLRGEMSLVGPRPCVQYEFEKYTPRDRGRCATLPGLTGLWQVSGKNKTTFQEMMDLDLSYVHNRSLWLDISIIARTIPALVVQTIETKRKGKKAKHSLGR